MKVGSTYVGCGKSVRVVKVHPDHVEVVWSVNGSTPTRQCDRIVWESLYPYFEEV
jgi:hypothetical protein